jgi:hypothetical protein
MEGRCIEDLRVVFSDDRYPWPPGKRPGGAMSGNGEKIIQGNIRLEVCVNPVFVPNACSVVDLDPQ